MDGVTTALELEVGTGDVDRWYAERDGKTLISYGVSVGHLAARMVAMGEPIEFVPTGEAAQAATKAEIVEMAKYIEHGLRQALSLSVSASVRTASFTRGNSRDVSRCGELSRVVSCSSSLRGREGA